MRQLVILAGGKGTRLKDRLGDLPKPLIDVCGLPLLERQILLAKHYGFDQVLILVNHKGQQIVDFCVDKKNWQISVECVDDLVPLGTAGAVLNVLDRLEDDFLVMYGDTMLDVDLKRFCDAHQQLTTHAATLFLHPNDHPHDSDLVEMDELGFVTQFHPYPHQNGHYYPNLVNAALYCVRKSSLLPYRREIRSEVDFGKHLFPQMIRDGVELRGYNSPEYIKDCGTPERIDKVRLDFSSGKISRASLANQQAAIFLDRDGTIIEQVDHLNTIEQVVLLNGAAAGVRRFNQEGYKTCLITNQPVIARGECSVEMLKQIHNKLETSLGLEAAFLDRIYYCPHHPDKGFAGEVPSLKIACRCRKPDIGLIEKAVAELNVNCSTSWLIGDTTTDIATAKRAGLKSVLVETGYAGLDKKNPELPDFVVPNLEAAASLIIDIYPRFVGNYSVELAEIKPGSLLFIGGQSRSGKSTFASFLKFALHGLGQRCHVISTDRWILSDTDRQEGVLGRHSVEELERCLELLQTSRTNPCTIRLPTYSKAQRIHTQDAETVLVHPGDIFIIEGVISLATNASRTAARRFYVEIEESERKNRILTEYVLRGYSLETANAIYAGRVKDEVPFIEALKQDAIEIRLS